MCVCRHPQRSVERTITGYRGLRCLLVLVLALTGLSACADDTDRSSADTPSAFFGGGGPGAFGGGAGNYGGGADASPGVEAEGGGLCGDDADCPGEAPWCSVSGLCFQCIQDDHCGADSVCTNGTCLSAVCSPGQTQCSGDTQLTCTATGAGWSSLECPGAAGRCVNGACTDCPPGYTECVGKSERVVCQADGSSLIQESCGVDGMCVQGACTECYPGTKQCADGWAQTCSAMGTWASMENCGQMGSVCSNGQCQSNCGQAGKLSNEGCDYWAIDMDNAGPAADSPYGVIVSNLGDAVTSVVIRSQGAWGDPQVLAEGTVQPGDLEVFALPQQNMGESGIFWKALRIQTSGPIVAYQFNPLENVGVYSNDASLLLPSNTYGTEYIVVSREEIPASGTESFRGAVAVVATSPDTQVSITPTAWTQPGDGLPVMAPGETHTVTLQPYQVLNFQSDQLGGDLTGTVIFSDKPIGVFGGHQAAVGGEQCCADHLEQQLFPVSTWGKTYVAAKSSARGVEGDYWRFVAAKDGTQITLSPSLPGVPSPITLNRGDFYEVQTAEDFVVNASEPIMVAQTLASSNEIAGPPACLSDSDCALGYSCSIFSPECMLDSSTCYTDSDCPASHTCGCDGAMGDLGYCSCEPMGDPALILSVPVEQFRDRYVFLTPANFLEDYVNVVAPVSATVTLDGAPLGSYLFGATLGGQYKVARVAVGDGVHVLESSEPVGVVVYGYDDDVSYGYAAGLSLSDL